MYESFYGFEKRVFATVPDTARYFPIHELMAARETLAHVIENAEGPGVVVGPAGVGKTLLCELLKDRFRGQFEVVVLSCGRLRELQDMLQAIVHQLRLPHQGQNEGELRLTLLDFLEPSAECPHGLLLLVDEAQHLSIELLEELRMISNFVRDGAPRVRIVLLGNQRLEENLTNPKLESLNQRLAARCYLEGMNREESREYVVGLTNAAGGALGLWNEDALRSIYDATDGIPRVINQLCNRTLASAANRKALQIDGKLVQQAWSDLQQLPTPWSDESEETTECVIEFGGLDEEPTEGPSTLAENTSTSSEVLEPVEPVEPVKPVNSTEPDDAETIVAEPSAEFDAGEYSTIDLERPVKLADGNWEDLVSSTAPATAGDQQWVQYELAPEALEQVAMIEARLAEIEDSAGISEPPLAAHGEAVENPFGDFPEEEVVLAEHIPLGDPGRTLGPRVTGETSRYLAESLRLEEPTPPPGPAFRADKDDYNQREIGIDESVEREQEHEPATVVPIFAATRDDRDIIVIEDDHPQSMQNRQVIHKLRGKST